MNKPKVGEDALRRLILENLRRWKEDYEKAGYIPTLELLIADLEEQIKNNE